MQRVSQFFLSEKKVKKLLSSSHKGTHSKSDHIIALIFNRRMTVRLFSNLEIKGRKISRSFELRLQRSKINLDERRKPSDVHFNLLILLDKSTKNNNIALCSQVKPILSCVFMNTRQDYQFLA